MILKNLKPIPGFPDYFASADGSIWSMKRPHNDREAPKEPRKLKPQITRAHHIICLCLNRKKVFRYVGHLVLESFVGPRPEGMEMCHGPNGKLDDSLSNLYWDTRSRNLGADRLRDGTDSRGEKYGAAKLSEQDVRDIRAVHGKEPRGETALRYGVGRTQIARIQNRT